MRFHCPMLLRFLLFAASVAAAQALVAQAAVRDYTPTKVSQESIPLSSTVYADMDALYLMTGKGTPSNARPWTKTEAGLILARVERASLGGRVTGLYDAIAKAVEPGLRFGFRDGFGFGFAFDANVEAYAHDNQDYDLESDWILGFEERKPLLKLALDFSLKDLFYVYCDLQYGRNRFNYEDTQYKVTDSYPAGIGAIVLPGDTQALMVSHSVIYSQFFLTNILEHSYDFDFQWPKRAVASVGGANWNFSLARDKVSWGNGHSGNFIVGSHVDYQDYARLVAFSDLFKYDWLTVFLDANTKPGEQPDTEFRIFIAHRLEFRILDGLTFAISEDMMYQNDVFDFRYLNPAFIYHNLNNRSLFNAIAHVELDWSFMKGFNLYAQVVMDQARAPNELAVQGDAMGYLGGIEYAAMAGPGILSTSLECALTDPLLYRRDGVDFLMYRKYFTNGYPGPGYILSLDYLGYPYGGDALVLQWDLGWRVSGRGSVGLRLFGMRHGEMDFLTSHNKDGDNAGYPNYEGTTPSGDKVTETLVAGLSGDYAIPSLPAWLAVKLWANLDWVNQRTFVASTGAYADISADFQLTAGLSVSF